eukprot:jgi/Botrbrau1/8139/Bobra.0308s0029.1
MGKWRVPACQTLTGGLHPSTDSPPGQSELQSQVNKSRNSPNKWDEVQIQNEYFELRVSKVAGGAITYLSRAGEGRNVINRWDTGRLIQQSYYGSEDGSRWAGQPWKWNPVQGGDWQGATGILLDLKRKSDFEISTVSIPRNWGGGQLLIEVVMESHITLKKDHIMIQNKVYHSGWKSQMFTNQELPAAFLTRSFSRFWWYNGTDPWSGRPLSWLDPQAYPDRPQPRDLFPTEKWGAYEDTKTGLAVGLMSSAAIAYEVYRVGLDDKGGPDDPDCSYMAPIGQFGLNASSGFSYTAYLTLGRVPDIRKVFEWIHQSSQERAAASVDDNYA